MFKQYFKSPVGVLEIVADDKYIIAINFVSKVNKDKSNALTKQCVVQLEKYFKGQIKIFSLPIKLLGTPFQQKVYLALSKIPYGHIISYQDLATMSGSSQAARAIGNAVNKNKIPIIIPCHRVLGASGKLVGYAGGLWRKKSLLDLEQNFD